MRVVVTGLVATYPVGGVAWDYLQYVQGFRALGCEVTYLEDTGPWLYGPAAQTFTDDVRANARYLNDALASLDVALPRCWSLRAPDGAYHGLDEAAVARACAAADLFLNLSGSCWLRDAYRAARLEAYVDTDPGYSQASPAAGASPTRPACRPPGPPPATASCPRAASARSRRTRTWRCAAAGSRLARRPTWRAGSRRSCRRPAGPPTCRPGPGSTPSPPPRRRSLRWRPSAPTTPAPAGTRARSPRRTSAPRTCARASSPTRGSDGAHRPRRLPRAQPARRLRLAGGALSPGPPRARP